MVFFILILKRVFQKIHDWKCAFFTKIDIIFRTSIRQLYLKTYIYIYIYVFFAIDFNKIAMIQ